MNTYAGYKPPKMPDMILFIENMVLSSYLYYKIGRAIQLLSKHTAYIKSFYIVYRKQGLLALKEWGMCPLYEPFLHFIRCCWSPWGSSVMKKMSFLI